MIIRNARVLTFDAANRVLESGAVEVLLDGSSGQVRDTPVGAERSSAIRRPPGPYGPQSFALRQPAPTTKSVAPPLNPLLVNGRFVLRNKECVTVDEREVAEKASIRARALGKRF